MRLAILFANYGPYHLARLAAAAQHGREKGLRVVGLEWAGRENIYPRQTRDINETVEKYTLYPGAAVEDLRPYPLAQRMWLRLNRLNPLAVAICGITGSGMLSALLWTRYRRRVAVLMMATKANDKPRRPLKEWIKSRIISRFDAALVGGSLSRAYVIELGIPPDKVFMGYDVVDNPYFSSRAEHVRTEAAFFRNQHGLPTNYFLCVSRFIEKKNLSGLLKAYARYCQLPTAPSWGLVICGSGPQEAALKRQALDLGLHQVRFAGFRQIDELPIYYGLARCLILPSLGDTWGLVVNEAMACGLPVLVSTACGCAPDLVQEGINGFTFDPYDVEGLASLMWKMSSGELNLKTMGAASQRLIADWTPATFAQNLLKAVEVAMACRCQKRLWV